MMKLVEIKEFKGTIQLKSGLHIGAGDTEMRIGGIDNQVIRHPHTNEPYIPGSSLKGKVRSLLELKSGLMKHTNGNPISLKALRHEEEETTDVNNNLEKKLTNEEIQIGLNIVKLFGSSGADEDERGEIGPTRVSFADCSLNEEWKRQAEQRDWPLVELKTENAINRIKGTAENPRTTERVPAGALFDFSISLRVFEGDEEELEDLLFQGLKLLEYDALGGSGSRGYGKVKFEFNDPHVQKKFNETKVL
jgi:CRISPR-associated protein Csm3